MKPINVEDVPTPVKVLPVLAREMWKRVYNRTIKTATASKSREVAWQVIRQFYKKNSKGKWMKRANPLSTVGWTTPFSCHISAI